MGLTLERSLVGKEKNWQTTSIIEASQFSYQIGQDDQLTTTDIDSTAIDLTPLPKFSYDPSKLPFQFGMT